MTEIVVDIETGRLPVVKTKRFTEKVPEASPIGGAMNTDWVDPAAKVALPDPMPAVWPALFLKTAKTTTLWEVGLRFW